MFKTTWLPSEDLYLRKYYNSKIRVSPAILAMVLKTTCKIVIKRLRELGLKTNKEVW